MLILGINTVADACEAALVADGQPVSQLSEPMEQGHDARLAPIVERLMSEAGKAFADLGRIAVVVGPGSFTGVRVGVAFARGLSLSLDIPSVGVTSLEALDGLPKEGAVLGLLPAKRRPPERSWWGQMIAHGRGGADPFEATEDELRSLASGVDAICGRLSGIPDFGPRRIMASPGAKAAAVFAARLSDDDLPPPRPIYIRAPDARPMAQR
jgi:tRNA threonylcarbamoyladenosine biosynthesis protein TsaB